MTQLSKEQKIELRDKIKDISNIMAKIDLNRSVITEAIGAIAEEFDLDKKYVRKMSNVYHKGTYQKEIGEMEDFSTLYENVFKSNQPAKSVDAFD